MGQIKPITQKARRTLPNAEQRAVTYLRWITENLGAKYKMVPYFSAMMVEEITEKTIIDAKAEPQLAVIEALAALSDASS